MAKLYFYYSAMNAGKSTTLLQSAYNYNERQMNTLIYTTSIDNRFGEARVTSRIGISMPALVFNSTTDLFADIMQQQAQKIIHCILIDEAQFLTKAQVYQLTEVVDQLDLPVLCYGLRTDFQMNLFEGSQYLLAWADKLQELKTICYCGHKANCVLRLDQDGQVITQGAQIFIGDSEYLSVCRKHYKEKIYTV